METFRLDVGAGTVASGREAGAGPRLVFLHGLGCAGSVDWPPVAAAPALAGRAWQWFDLLGFGQSERPGNFSYRLDDQVAWLEARLAPEPGPVALVGHSLGGTLALLLAERLVARGRPPAALVVLEPNLRPEDATTSARVAATPLDAFLAGWPAWVESLGSPWYRRTVALSDPLAFHRTAVSLVSVGQGLLGRLAALPVPRGYVLGGRSDDATHQTARLVAAAGVRVETVPGSGHGFFEDDPQGCARAIAALLTAP